VQLILHGLLIIGLPMTRFIKFITTFLAALFMLTVASTAHANMINVIEFYGENEGVQDSFIFEKSGVELTVTAWTSNVNSMQEQLSPWSQVSGFDEETKIGVYKGGSGLGVVSNDIDGEDLDGGSSDKINDLDEGLLFSFSENVNFLGFAAGDLSVNDDLNLAIVDFISPTSIEITDIFIDVYSDYEEDIFDVFPGIFGKSFMVWVDGNDDDVRILDTAFIKVPEPTSALIFTLALFIFLFKRRFSY